PGIGTEGRALVLLMNRSDEYSHRRTRKRYLEIISELSSRKSGVDSSQGPLSPLAALLSEIWMKWKSISGSEDSTAFYHWLETTAPLDFVVDGEEKLPDAVASLDTLDSVILSALVEVDQLARDDLTENELEDRLQRIWQRSYARYALERQDVHESIFMK